MRPNFQNLIVICIMIFSGFTLTYWFDHAAPAQSSQPLPQDTREPDSQQNERSEHVPNFDFTTLASDSYNIQDFKGKVILLNFWASWCAPCVKEFPIFLTLAKTYPNDLVLIGLSSDLEEKTAQEFVTRMQKKHGFPFDQANVFIAHDKDQKIAHDLFQSYKLPETYVIGPDMKILKKLVGLRWTPEELSALIEEARPAHPSAPGKQ